LSPLKELHHRLIVGFVLAVCFQGDDGAFHQIEQSGWHSAIFQGVGPHARRNLGLKIDLKRAAI
jgi:hypothetical protein